MHKADNLPPSCAVVTKSGNLNFLEPSGSVQACNGTVFTFREMHMPCRRVSLHRDPAGEPGAVSFAGTFERKK